MAQGQPNETEKIIAIIIIIIALGIGLFLTIASSVGSHKLDWSLLSWKGWALIGLVILVFVLFFYGIHLYRKSKNNR